MWRDRTVWLTVSAITLACALQAREGMYSPIAVALLAVAFASMCLACWTSSVHLYHRLRPIALAVVVLSLIAHAFVALSLLRETPEPNMDVFVFQRDACRALLKGVNPYIIDYPNIYGPSGSWVYAPQFVHGDRLLFGFPYMPLTLWWDSMGHLLAQDYRYAQVAAVLITAVFIVAIKPSWASAFAAVLFLSMPCGFFVLKHGWTEPLTAMLLAATILCIHRVPKLAPIAFGLFVASKQYCVLSIPLLPLLLPTERAPRWRWIGIAALSAAVFTLPLVLPNFGAFWSNAVALQFRQPFREDSLSFAAELARSTGLHISTIVPVLLAMGVSVVLGRGRLTRDFACANAIVYFTFFAFNKQAFANYYFFVIAAICCAIASSSKTHAAS